MKKTEVYVVVDTPKKAKKLKKILDMFGESYGGCTFELLENKEGDKVYFNMGSEWNTDTASMIHRRLQEVSIKELRNILAREYLKEGDIVFMRFGVYESILRVKSVDDEFINVDKEVFVKTSDSIYNSGKEPIKNFIRYATEEEKALLEPKKVLEDGWFKHEKFPSFLVYIENIGAEGESRFGFNVNGSWFNKNRTKDLSFEFYYKATPQEVEKALIEEAKMRGHNYKEYEYNPEENELCVINNGRLESVFCDGHWEEPASNLTDSDISIVERLHDTLLDNHGYSLESKLLTDARMLANKIKSNIK